MTGGGPAAGRVEPGMDGEGAYALEEGAGGAYALAAAEGGRTGKDDGGGDVTVGVDCPALSGGGRGAGFGWLKPAGPPGPGGGGLVKFGELGKGEDTAAGPGVFRLDDT